MAMAMAVRMARFKTGAWLGLYSYSSIIKNWRDEFNVQAWRSQPPFPPGASVEGMSCKQVLYLGAGYEYLLSLHGILGPFEALQDCHFPLEWSHLTSDLFAFSHPFPCLPPTAIRSGTRFVLFYITLNSQERSFGFGIVNSNWSSSCRHLNLQVHALFFQTFVSSASFEFWWAEWTWCSRILCCRSNEGLYTFPLEMSWIPEVEFCYVVLLLFS